MSTQFKQYNPDQPYLLPPSLKDWLPESHLVYFIMDLGDQLDLTDIINSYTKSSKGAPAYHPKMMTDLYLYSYCTGTSSSRKIEQKTYEDVAYRVIAGGSHPDHDTIAEFRKRNLKALMGLFVQVLNICKKANLVKLGHVSLDGTKVKANASKHKAMSYTRMCKKEEELKKIVEELFKKAEETDEYEDKKYGKGKKAFELPEELKFQEGRLRKIREAKAALEEEAKERAKKEEEERRKKELEAAKKRKGKKRGRKPKPISKSPKAKAQKNFTDPESRIMKESSGKGFIQAYNAQAAVDADSQVIVAADVVNAPVDKQQAVPMVEKIKKNTGKNPNEISGDAGYYSEENVEKLEKKKIDVYITPGKENHTKRDEPAVRGRPPNNLSIKEKMIRKLRTKKGKKKYGRRKETVEPVFGQIKHCRGFRQFLLRGLEKVQGEWNLMCTTHNILKLYRSGYAITRA